MNEEDLAAKELFEAKRQYREAESALAVATARLNQAERACHAIFDRRMKKAMEPKPMPKQSLDWPRHYDSQGYCDNPGRGY